MKNLCFQIRPDWTLLASALCALIATVDPTHAAEFSCPAGDVSCLVTAIGKANQKRGQNTIRLETGTYSLAAVDNDADGPNALPDITGSITIVGAGADQTIIERSAGAPVFRVFHVGPGGTLTLESVSVRGGVWTGGAIFNRGNANLVGSSIYGNGVIGMGGGMVNLGTSTVETTVVSGNASSAGAGGGIFNGGTMTVLNSTIADNAGIDARSPGGAGIANGENATLTVADSSFSSNQLVGDSGTGAAVANAGSMTIYNTTIADNKVNVDIAPGEGGGAFNTGTLSVTNATIVVNEAGGRGGGLGGGISNRSGRVKLANTILALNAATAIAIPPFNPPTEGPDCFGLISSLGNNLIGDRTGCDISLLASDLTGDPRLDGFTNDGNPGNGHFPLLETSPAIDAGNNEVCSSQPPPATDQLGEPRIGVCDIGAIEFQPASSAVMVALEVRPGGSEGSVNPKSRGLLPVAIFSTDDFDATTVDIGSVRLGAGEAAPSRGKGQRRDVNRDGRPDLVLQFHTQESGIQCGDNSVLLTAQTMDLVPIQGSAAIRTVGCKNR